MVQSEDLSDLYHDHTFQGHDLGGVFHDHGLHYYFRGGLFLIKLVTFIKISPKMSRS